jgi:hypothetical protein
MVIDYRGYTLIPGTVDEFLDRFKNEGLQVQLDILGNFLGIFRTEIGRVNEIIHMWGYENALERQIRRDKLFADPGFKTYVAKQRKLIVAQDVRLLTPADFSPITAVAQPANSPP